jgi:hypothetical protein
MGLGIFAVGCKQAKGKFARVARGAWYASTHNNIKRMLAVLAALAMRAPIAHIARQEFIGI